MAVTIDGTTGVSLVQDGVVTAADMFSGFANGIKNACTFRVISDVNLSDTSGEFSDITTFEEVDDAVYSGFGSHVTESSGIFSFNETGLYLIIMTVMFDRSSSGVRAIQAYTSFSSDSGSTYDRVNEILTGMTDHSGSETNFTQASTMGLYSITNTSTSRIKMECAQYAASGVRLKGNTSTTRSGFTFIRIGDAQ